MTPPVPAAVFASGSGTNLQALLDHETAHGRYHIVVVISDRKGAGALARAEAAGRMARVIEVGGRPPEEVATETLELLESLDVRAIFLAGYLRLVPSAVVSAYRRRVLNIHPALLPAFGGEGMFGDGPGSDTYTQWFDNNLAEYLSDNGQFGIADTLMKEFERWNQIPAEQTEGAPADHGDGAVPKGRVDVAA